MGSTYFCNVLINICFYILFPKQLPAVGVLAVLVEGPVNGTGHRLAEWPPEFAAITDTW